MEDALDQLKTVASRALTKAFSIATGDTGTKNVVVALQTTPAAMPVKHTIFVQKIRISVRTGAAVTWTFQDASAVPVTAAVDVSVAGGMLVFDFGPVGFQLTDNANLQVVLSGGGAAGDLFIEGYQRPVMGANNGIPSFASIAPPSGPAAGGTAVAVFGAGFRPGASVTIAGVALTSVQFISSQELLGITGAHAAGASDVVVTNPAPNGSETVTGAGAFTYV